MPHILSFVNYPAVHYSSTLSHKRHDLKKNLEHKMCVLIYSTILSEIFFTLTRIKRHMIINVSWSSSKVPVIRIRF